MEAHQNKNPNEYLKTKVLTASQEELQLMLYDGAIRFCEQARVAIEKNEIENSFNLLSRAEKIIMEMYVAVREEYAPDVSTNIKKLYMFCYQSLVDANLTKDVAKVDEALRVLRHLRDTWKMLIDTIHQQQQEESVPAAAPANKRPAREPVSVPDLNAEIGSLFNIEG